MESQTKRSTRIIIWVIAIVMAVGFVGSYFLIIMNNDNTALTDAQTQAQTTESSKMQQKPDPTAYKVEGPVTSLQITDLKEGNGPAVHRGDTIRVHYKGTLAQSGVKFDSSYDHGEPATFKLQEAGTDSGGGVITGWVQGMEGMKEGGKRRLLIPASLAYGEQGTQGIQPNSDLVFEVELLAVNPPAASQNPQ